MKVITEGFAAPDIDHNGWYCDSFCDTTTARALVADGAYLYAARTCPHIDDHAIPDRSGKVHLCPLRIARDIMPDIVDEEEDFSDYGLWAGVADGQVVGARWIDDPVESFERILDYFGTPLESEIVQLWHTADSLAEQYAEQEREYNELHSIAVDIEAAELELREHRAAVPYGITHLAKLPIMVDALDKRRDLHETLAEHREKFDEKLAWYNRDYDTNFKLENFL